MKKRTFKKKLTLNKQKVVGLRNEEMSKVKGGLADTFFCTSGNPVHMCNPCDR